MARLTQHAKMVDLAKKGGWDVEVWDLPSLSDATAKKDGRYVYWRFDTSGKIKYASDNKGAIPAPYVGVMEETFRA